MTAAISDTSVHSIVQRQSHSLRVVTVHPAVGDAEVVAERYHPLAAGWRRLGGRAGGRRGVRQLGMSPRSLSELYKPACFPATLRRGKRWGRAVSITVNLSTG